MAADSAGRRRRHIAVVGSINLDFAARVGRLPVPGETLTDAELGRYPGGKGANQALAARRLGAEVTLLGCVGADTMAHEALVLLKEAGVNLESVAVDAGTATGIALITVAASGENQIVVAPGANRRLRAEHVRLPQADALICQLEIPLAAVETAARDFQGFFCANLAPARPVAEYVLERADLVVVNEIEAEFYGETLAGLPGLVAVTAGERGARLLREGAEIAAARPPVVEVVDTTGAGDTFTSALTLALVEGRDPADALAFACAAGALATTVAGAQTSLPLRSAVDDILEA